MEYNSLFNYLDKEEAAKFQPEISRDWKWSYKDYPDKNGLKVFSCFACGGGSTMGYKLAGCDVIGCCEIDPRMNEIYQKNHNPKYNFLMDIRDFNALPNDSIPSELFDIDILDGSPPCTTFSMVGDREKSWGKKKKFAEGQTMQTLDDLSFVFIETVKKLRPKTVIMENVEGLLLGKAWRYVQKIYLGFEDAGYYVKHFLLKGELMGIPQRRHRVFFIAIRKDLSISPDNINLVFNYEPVTYKQIKEGDMFPISESSKFYAYIRNANDKDKSIADTRIRLGEKGNGFQTIYIRDDNVMPTIRGSWAAIIDIKALSYVSNETIRNAQTFPTDYDFGSKSRSKIGYVCGMSVPPLMIKRIMTRLIGAGVYNYRFRRTEE